MTDLDAATVLLQWATGGLLFLWVTARRREVGIGYGWLLRGVFGVLAAGALASGLSFGDRVIARDAACAAVVLFTGAAFAMSVVRRKAGIDGTRPALDLLAPLAGAAGLVAAAWPEPLVLVRTFAGAAFLGAVSDAMLLGHWYLVQPGLRRAPLNELNLWLAIAWPVEVGALLWPTGMASVWSGAIDDGYGGLLGWFWAACAITTIVLTGVTAAALKERAYTAVMAATGLLYLAILTAFGTDLVARALLSGA